MSEKLDRILEVLNTGGQIATLGLGVAGVTRTVISGIVLGVKRMVQSDGTVTYAIILEEGEKNIAEADKNWDETLALIQAQRK